MLILLLLIIVSLNLETARATPIPVLDVSRLTREAQLIVVGQVTLISEEKRGDYEIQGKAIPARLMAASFRVDRVLKGEAGTELSFRYLLPDLPVGYPGLVTDQFGMFFLRPAPEGLVFASPYHPFIVATQEGCVAKGDALSRVVAELGCVLHSSITTNRDRVTAIQALSRVETVDATAVFRRAVRELSSPLKLLAASVLLSRGDMTVLPLIEQALQHSSVLVVQDEGYRMEMRLGGVLRDVKDPAAIPALARLIESTEVETRRGAAQGLRNVGTEAAIEPLAKALYDSDWEVRWLAVMGIAGITGPGEDGNSWYPSYDKFKQEEERYLDHWREWVKRRGK